MKTKFGLRLKKYICLNCLSYLFRLGCSLNCSISYNILSIQSQKMLLFCTSDTFRGQIHRVKEGVRVENTPSTKFLFLSFILLKWWLTSIYFCCLRIRNVLLLKGSKNYTFRIQASRYYTSVLSNSIID